MFAFIFRCACICFFIFSEICCQHFQNGMGAQQRFGFYTYKQKPLGSASVIDTGSVKGGGPTFHEASSNPIESLFSSNTRMQMPPKLPSSMWMEPVPESAHSLSQANPEWPTVELAREESDKLQPMIQEVKVQSTVSPVQVTPVEVTRTPVQMVLFTGVRQLPAQVNQVQKPPTSASVTDYGSVEGEASTSSEVSRNPIVNQPSSQENRLPPNAGMQMPPWMWMQSVPAGPFSLSQANPEWPLPKPSQGDSNQLQSVRQVVKVQGTVPPVEVTPEVITKASVQMPQKKTVLSPAQVSQELTQTPQLSPPNLPDGSEGALSGQARYLFISSPSGFQTRYIVRSFNRFVRGKNFYSQTTYIPLDFVKPAPAPTVPGHDF